MGKIIAEALDGELDVVLVHKLGAPGNPELAIGAVSEDGQVLLREGVEEYGISREYIRQEVDRQQHTLQNRRRAYTPGRDRIDPEGRTVIIVDDGAATGSTIMAALQTLREAGPARLTVALGVASEETIEMLEKVADEVVCLEVPGMLYGVSQAFQEFEQVSDGEVIEMLQSTRRNVASTD